MTVHNLEECCAPTPHFLVSSQRPWACLTAGPSSFIGEVQHFAADSGFHISAFYTAKYGYKLCLRLYLNGDGTGKKTHLSLFIVIMKGEYDALLPWPFRNKVRGQGKQGGWGWETRVLVLI